MVSEYRSFFNIGLFDPLLSDSWPWECKEIDGVYLSEKNRVCSVKKAAIFDSIAEARQFFNDWKGKGRWKLHIVEYKTTVEVPEPVFSDDHPHSILHRIWQNERHAVWVTATLWYEGNIKQHYISKQTVNRHRKKLLPYGIDINIGPEIKYSKPKMKEDLVWHTSKADLSLVSSGHKN